MNRKQFLILLVLVVVVGAAGLWVRQTRDNSWHDASGLGHKLLPDLPVNDIAAVAIKSDAGQVNLARTNNLWRVQERADYPANFSQLSELLLKFADLKVAQNEEVGPSQLGRFELLAPGSGPGAGTSVEFKDQTGKVIGSLLLGKKHMKKPAANGAPGGMGDEGWPDGRYVIAGASSHDVALVSDPLDSVQVQPVEWVNKDFLSVEKPLVITVQFPEATNSWKLARGSETNEWQLAELKSGEKLDASKISAVTSPFSSVSFSDVLPRAAGDGLSNIVVTVETADGFTYVSQVGLKHGDNYPVTFAIAAHPLAERLPAGDEKPADKASRDKEFAARQKTLADKFAKESAFTHWTYQIPAYSLDELLKSRQQLLEDASTNAAASSPK
jgi:hypothetical protein